MRDFPELDERGKWIASGSCLRLNPIRVEKYYESIKQNLILGEILQLMEMLDPDFEVVQEFLAKKDSEMSDLRRIDLRGVEEYREYDFEGRIYRIDKPIEVQFRDGGETHRVTDESKIVHCVPAPGVKGCVLRWKGAIVA